MDSDCLQLNGLLQRVDEAITTNHYPSAITCGYQVDSKELPLIRYGVELDMRVRAAMNGIIPYSAYFPEPASFFCVRHPPGSSILSRISFAGGTSETLENRRLIQNGRLAKLFDNRAIFIAEGGIVTQTPERMKTAKNKEWTTVSKADMKLESSLKALRGISQTHAHPKDWADNLYSSLGIKAKKRMTDATGPMMHIFKVYDPISRMFDSEYRFNDWVFNEEIKNYSAPLTAKQKEKIAASVAALLKANIPQEKIDLIIKAAIESGKAIHQFLVGKT